MAHIDFLRDQMERDLAVMDDHSKPFDVRRAARSRFWHCEKRVGAMERAGLTEDEPGHYLVGYSEIGFGPTQKGKRAALTPDDQRRELNDRRTEVQIAAREKL
jgi:hypothetical protein